MNARERLDKLRKAAAEQTADIKSESEAMQRLHNMRQVAIGQKAKRTVERVPEETPKPKTRRQEMEDELTELKKSPYLAEKVEMQGIADNRSWEEIYAEQQERDAVQRRVNYLENQLRRDKGEEYYAGVQRRMAQLDKETVGYLDQLLEGKPQTLANMQGIADNRSWEEVYAEEQAWEETVRQQLREKGYDDSRIAQMADDRQRQVNRETFKQEVAASQKEAEERPVWASVKSVPQNMTGGLGALSLAAQNAHKALTGDERPVDYYTPEMVGQAKAQAVRQTVSQNLEENTEFSTKLTGNVAAFLYNTGMSMADSAAAAVIGNVAGSAAAGASLLGGTAATQAAVDAKERGASDGQALFTGLAAGAAETFFEKVSLGNLLESKPARGTLTKRIVGVLKEAGLQAGVEGSEEFFTTVANTLTDAIINGESSAYRQSVYNYMAQGYSEAEATKMATQNWIRGLAQDFLGGAISGGVMGGGKAALQTSAETAGIGRALRGAETPIAQERRAQKAGDQLARRVQEEVGSNGGGVTNRQRRELLERNLQAVNARAEQAEVDAVAARLQELGETGDKAAVEKIARAVVREAAENKRAVQTIVGGERAVAKSTYGAQVARELREGAEWTKTIPAKVTREQEIDRLQKLAINPDATDSREVTGGKYNAATGKMDAIVKNDDGTKAVIPMKKASATVRQMELAEEAAVYGKDGATMMAAIRPEQQADTYARQWRIAYEYGLGGIPETAVMKSTALGHLLDEQKRMAYEMGQRAAKEKAAQNAKERAARSGKPRRRGTVSMKGAVIDGVRYQAVDQKGLTGKQRASIRYMRALAAQTGINVVFYESLATETGRLGANGVYLDNTIYLDIAAGVDHLDLAQAAILRTAGHELTHFIQDMDEEAYNKVKKFVLEKLTEKEGVDLETLVQRQMAKNRQLSHDEAIDEVVADACEMMLKDSHVLEALAREDRSLAEKIVEFLKDLMQRLRAAFEGVEARSEEAKAVAEYTQELQELWDAALRSAVECDGGATKNTAEDGGVAQYSIREIDGRIMPVIDTKNDTREVSVAQSYLRTLINEEKPFATILMDDQAVYVGKDLPGEYSRSEYTAQLRKAIRKVKMQAATNLDEMLLLAQNGEWRENVKEKHKVDAKNGWYRYETEFAVPVLNAKQEIDHYTVYGATLLVRNDADGKSYLYDMLDLAEKKKVISSPSSTAKKRSEIFEPKPSGKNVPQTTPGVKGQKSMRAAVAEDPVVQAGSMEKAGAGRDEIWKSTGLIRDAAGRWAAELDDSRMKVFPNGDALMADDPEYRRYMELAREGDFFSDEYRTLRDKFRKVSGKKTLEQYVQHDELFRYFPALRDVEFIFRDLGGEKQGYWSAAANAIVLDENLKKGINRRQLSRTAIHEIQHAMQHLEKRAGGSNKSYWEKKLREGYRRGKNDTRIQEADAEYRRLFAAAPDDVKRVVREINRAYLAKNYDRAAELADSMAGTEHEDAFWAIDEADFARRMLRNSNEDMTASELYRNTAGEIEAKSAEQRLLMTEEQRRERMPDLQWEDAVFADGRYSLRDTEITDRDILSATLESSGQTETEKTLLERYRRHAAELAGLERELAIQRQKLQDHERPADDPRHKSLSAVELTQARNRAASYARQIDQKNKILKPLEKRAELQAVAARERAYIEEALQGDVEAYKGRYAPSLERKLADQWVQARTWERRYYEAAAQNVGGERAKRQSRKAQLRKDIRKASSGLADLIVTNTDKKHVPEDLKAPLAEFLNAMDLSSPRLAAGGAATRWDINYGEKLAKVKEVLDKRTSAVTGGGSIGDYLDLPTEFTERLQDHIDEARRAMETLRPGETVLGKMDVEQLENLHMILSVLKRSIETVNSLMANRRFKAVDDAAKADLAHMRELGAGGGDQTTALGKAEGFLSWTNLLPVYAFRKLGKGAQSIFEGLQDGWDKLARNAEQVIRFTEQTYTPKEAKAWTEEVHEVELHDPVTNEPSKVYLTTAQIMSLWALSQRPQALGHIVGDADAPGMGIRPEDIVLPKSKAHPLGKTIRQDEHFRVAAADIYRLTGLLTDRQLEVAKALQAFMEQQGSAWGNEVSMERHGYLFFGEKNYFPIETDRQSRPEKSVEQGSENDMYRLLNISATKAVMKRAKNAIMVRNIFDVYSNHMADMAKYNALALPLLDAVKWYNWAEDIGGTAIEGAGDVNLKRQITKTFGMAANSYIVQFIRDMNGVKEGGGVGEGLNKLLISNYKRASVAANLRVALLQPTSYVRAGAMIDGKYLAKAANAMIKSKDAAKEMREHSGIALWKSMGFFDTDVGRSMREQIKGTQGAVDRLVEKSMWLAEKGDEKTWAALWTACKLEQADKGLQGEALMDATADRFREVVYATQVVDSTMTRSGIMRSTTTFAKMATSFMSEPTVSYNMIMEAVDAVRADMRKGKGMNARMAVKKNAKALEIAFGSYIVAALASAIVESVFDAIRDDDDEKFLDKLLAAVGGNVRDNLNVLDNVPVVKDILALLEGDAAERMDLQGAATMVVALLQWQEVFRVKTGRQESYTKLTSYGNQTAYGRIYQTFRGFSYLSGIPAAAALREVQAAWNNTVGAVWSGLKWKTYENKDAVRAKNMYEAMVEGDKTAWEKESTKWQQQLIKEGAAQREALSAVRGGVKAVLKEDYYTGTMDAAETEKYLTAWLGMKADDAKAQRLEWDCYVETGIKFGDIRSLYERGEIDRSEVLELRAKYGQETRDEAESKAKWYDWGKEYPGYADLTEKKAGGWYDYVERSGLSAERYYQIAMDAAEQGVNSQDELVAFIRKQGLPAAQQKALWKALKNSSWKNDGTPWA